jgi:DNA-binding MarR family transcriptional regulator
MKNQPRKSPARSVTPADLSRKAQGLPLSEGILPPEANVDLGLMRDSISFQLRHASWAVHTAFGLRFAPVDAVPRQYSVLYLISINSGISVKALAAAIGVDQSTLVPTLNICEERGWITRTRSKPDRRVAALDLTDAGRRMLAEMQDRLTAHETAMTAELTEPERKTLLALLRKVRSSAMTAIDEESIK